MLFSLPFALPAVSGSSDQGFSVNEQRGVIALLQSMAICISIGLFLRWIGRGSLPGTLDQKEAMAVVGLSWILATILGALPYKLS